MRRLTAIERLILVGALQDRDYAGVVKCRAAKWLGAYFPDTTAEIVRRAVSRSYRSLERRGLVQRLMLSTSRSVTTHLRLSESGVAVAQEYAADFATPDESAWKVAGDG